MRYTELPIGERAPVAFNVIVEIPKGSANKYEYEETVANYSDVHPHRLREIEHFFGIYKELEGKRTETQGWRNADEARRVIRAASERFQSDR